MRYTPTPIPDALEYIRDQLRAGRGLASVLSHVDLAGGEVTAFLPKESQHLGGSFARGAMPSDSAKDENALNALVDHLIRSYGLTVTDEVVLISQFADGATEPTVDARPDRPPLTFPTVWLTGADRDYQKGELWFADIDSDRAQLLELLRASLWFPAVAVIARTGPEQRLERNQRIDRDSLCHLVSSPPALLCGAWDAMNYLIWARRDG